ncbi:mechanosensitive ion channel [Nitzschia inconspicua]|uniref:Mechanosensitive ion channel n=1 Tax=Nitzschia inconspicua TaxID=303405 RepID=A0A9K3PLM3_9STRA|nr:mechanosensitive ion channel [Nitzschia inconspicua]
MQTPVLQYSGRGDSESDDHHQNDQDYVTPNAYLSPDGETPRRILSSHSLIGEDIDDETTPASFRRTSSGFDTDLSPFTPTSQEEDCNGGFGVNKNDSITPPFSIQEPPASLSPPLFTTYRSSDSITESSLKEPIFNASPQSHRLEPRTHMYQPIGIGLSRKHKPHISSSVDATLHAASEKLSVVSAGSTFNQNNNVGNGRIFPRPPRAPHSSSQQSSPYRNGPQQPIFDVARLADSGNSNNASGGAGHSRVPTDSTNYTFLSALTDATAEYGMPRRRTKSLDEGHDTINRGSDRRVGQSRGGIGKDGRGTRAALEHGLGGGSLSVSILQPILSEEVSAPPLSIFASNLKKPTPELAQPILPASSASITEGMGVPLAPMGGSVLFPPSISAPIASSSVAEGLSHGSGSQLDGFPRATFNPRAEALNSSPPPPFLSPRTFDTFPGKELYGEEKELEERLGTRHPPSLEATSETTSLECNEQPKQYQLSDVMKSSRELSDESDVIQSIESSQMIDPLLEMISSSLLPEVGDKRVSLFGPCEFLKLQEISNLTNELNASSKLMQEAVKKQAKTKSNISCTLDDIKDEFLLIIFPSLAVTILLLFGMHDPECSGRFESRSSSCASSNHWFSMFFQQIGIHIFMRLCQSLLIEVFASQTRTSSSPMITAVSLVLIQSRRWPFMMFGWGLVNSVLHYCNSVFLFGNVSPIRGAADLPQYRCLIFCSLILSSIVTMKRIIVGNLVGARLVAKFSFNLSELMEKLLLFQQLSILSTQMDQSVDPAATEAQRSFQKVERTYDHECTPNNLFEILNDEQDLAFCEKEKQKNVTVADIIQFHRAIQCIINLFPLSPSLGIASTRIACLESSQFLFDRLASGSHDGTLDCKILARLSVISNGATYAETIRRLKKILCPNSQGKLAKIDFLRVADGVYKEWRLLLENLKCSSEMNCALETSVDGIFYAVLLIILLVALGIDVGSLIVSLSSIFVGVTVLCGTICSKHLQGILLMLIDEPFDIGDRVRFADTLQGEFVDQPRGPWIIEEMNPLTTTLRSTETGECTIFANGSLVRCNITNLKRSSKASISTILKFPIQVDREQLQLFRHRITEWIEARPREWIRIQSFRLVRIEAHMQYVEYVLTVQHRERWQNFGAIEESKSDLLEFALDVQRELELFGAE